MNKTIFYMCSALVIGAMSMVHGADVETKKQELLTALRDNLDREPEVLGRLLGEEEWRCIAECFKEVLEEEGAPGDRAAQLMRCCGIGSNGPILGPLLSTYLTNILEEQHGPVWRRVALILLDYESYKLNPRDFTSAFIIILGGEDPDLAERAEAILSGKGGIGSRDVKDITFRALWEVVSRERQNIMLYLRARKILVDAIGSNPSSQVLDHVVRALCDKDQGAVLQDLLTDVLYNNTKNDLGAHLSEILIDSLQGNIGDSVNASSMLMSMVSDNPVHEHLRTYALNILTRAIWGQHAYNRAAGVLEFLCSREVFDEDSDSTHNIIINHTVESSRGVRLSLLDGLIRVAGQQCDSAVRAVANLAHVTSDSGGKTVFDALRRKCVPPQESVDVDDGKMYDFNGAVETLSELVKNAGDVNLKTLAFEILRDSGALAHRSYVGGGVRRMLASVAQNAEEPDLREMVLSRYLDQIDAGDETEFAAELLGDSLKRGAELPAYVLRRVIAGAGRGGNVGYKYRGIMNAMGRQDQPQAHQDVVAAHKRSYVPSLITLGIAASILLYKKAWFDKKVVAAKKELEEVEALLADMGDDDEAGAQFFKKTVLTKRYKEAKRGYESLSWWQRLLRGSYRGFGIAAGVSGIRTWLAKRPLRQLHEAP